MIETFEMDPRRIVLPEDVVAGRLGFLGRPRVPDGFRPRYEECLEAVLERAFPSALYTERTVSSGDGRIVISERHIPGELAQRQLSNCGTATLVLATLGPGPDRFMEELHGKGETLSEFIVDGISSELVEFFVRELDLVLRKDRTSSPGRTRISPGYGDLPLELNGWLVEMLDGGSIGVSCVKGSFQLRPRKTVSAMIGWRD